MKSPITIVMYHYVRPIEGSKYPRLNGLELTGFEEQLDHIQKNYTVISAIEVTRAIIEKTPLPENPVLLTFDDGFADHSDFVMPALKRRNMTGIFFPPSCSVEERIALDVHKIHFILANVSNPTELVNFIESEVGLAKNTSNLLSLEEYRSKFFLANRFDTAEIIYVKRMLQVGLPEVLRKKITDRLFQLYVSKDEASFADDLYMSSDDLCRMLDAGMEIGSHGHAHYWLNSLQSEDQERDIDRSLDMLERIGASRENFFFCYPYGAYNEDTKKILASRGCAAAFTTYPELALLNSSSVLELPRLDTNDLMK